VFVFFWQKDFGAKAAHKMLVKLTPGLRCYTECHDAKCSYDECAHAECRYAECRYPEFSKSYSLTDAASILVGDGVYWTDTPISSGHPLNGLQLIRSHPARPPLRGIRASCQTVKDRGPIS
jgi:hypothetical protein